MSGSAERVIYEGPGSQWANVGRFMKCVLLAAFGITAICVSANIKIDDEVRPWISRGGYVIVALAVLLALRAWWSVRYLVYRVTTDRVELERGLLSKRLDNLDLFRVTDVQLRIGIAERLVGVGSIVLISTDKTTPQLVIAGVPGARQIYENLKRESLRADKRRGVLHMET